MNADGSDQVRLTNHPTSDWDASWSPDGQKIAFVTFRDYDIEIYVMSADGSNPINISNNVPMNAAVGFAPVLQSEIDFDKISYKIVFESYRETDGKENWEICMSMQMALILLT
jgi:Tol biopolymer transport system component